MKSEENKQKYEDISEIGFQETEADHEEENDQRQSRAEKAAFILHFSALPIRAA